MKITSLEDFEKQWQELANKIATTISNNEQIVQLKKNLETNGFLTSEEKSEFITLADKIKYDLIYDQYGAHDSEGYQVFKDFWQKWLGAKGVVSEESVSKSQENANHFMFGSTPDPEKFLREYNPA